MSARSRHGSDEPLTFFIAYASPDRAVAERLYDLLAMESAVFLDHRSLRLGDDWDRELAAAQQRAEMTVVLVSDRTDEGFYQREEIATAIQMARQGSHRVVPLWLSGRGRSLTVPYGLRVKQGLDVPNPADLTAVALKLLDERFGSKPAASRQAVSPTAVADSRAAGDHIVVRLPHNPLARLSDVTFSPDGRYVATAAGEHDRTARIWEFPAGREILRVTHHGSVKNQRAGTAAGIYGLAFSSDGRYLATAGGGDRTARVWELPGGRQTLELQHMGWLGAVMRVAFTPDGRWLLTSGNTKAVSLWDASDGRLVRQLKHGTFGTIYGIAVTEDGRYLATAGGLDETARIWELPSGRQVRVVKDKGRVDNVALSPDGRYLVTALNGWVRTRDLAGAGETLDLELSGQPGDLAFGLDGRCLAAVAFRSSTVQLWEMPAGIHLRQLEHDQWVSSVAFSPDSRHLATAGAGGAQIWALGGTGGPGRT